MQDMTPYIITSLAAFGGITVLALATLKGWRDWIELKKAELSAHSDRSPEVMSASPMARIEVADLKERVRKLEAIASGVEI